MGFDLIKVEEKKDGQITEITLGPAPANILSAKMMSEISTQLKNDERNPHKKLIIFSGEGKHFCFGASVEEHTAAQVTDMLPQFHSFIGNILHCPIPTLAKVTGLCLGGGFEMILACNFVFTDETAKFAVPEIQLAVFPPVAAILLPFRCGDVVTSQIVLTGEQSKAEELVQFGLVNHVCSQGKLDDVVNDFFQQQLHPKSASSLRMANKASRMSVCEHFDTLIPKLERLYLKDLMSTKDANEGIQSFLEKRSPQWKDE